MSNEQRGNKEKFYNLTESEPREIYKIDSRLSREIYKIFCR